MASPAAATSLTDSWWSVGEKGEGFVAVHFLQCQEQQDRKTEGAKSFQALVVISTGDSSRSRGSVAPVTALHSYWIIGLFSLSTKIDRAREVSYRLRHRKLFPIIAPLLGQQSVRPLIAKSNKNNYKGIREILRPSC